MVVTRTASAYLFRFFCEKTFNGLYIIFINPFSSFSPLFKTVSPCSPGWSGPYNIDQAVLKLTAIHLPHLSSVIIGVHHNVGQGASLNGFNFSFSFFPKVKYTNFHSEYGVYVYMFVWFCAHVSRPEITIH